jgi:hypothetical protein
MATTTNEINFITSFDWNSKTLSVSDASDYTGTNLSNIDPISDMRGLIKVVDPNGSTAYNNTSTGSPDITAAAQTIASFNATTNIFTITAHGYETGQPVAYDSLAGTDITGLTDRANYFIIKVDADRFGLATTYDNAISAIAVDVSGSLVGTQVFVSKNSSITINLPTNSDGTPVTGSYLVTLTMFDSGSTSTQYDRVQYVNLDYSRPTLSFDISHSVITPIFFKSIIENSFSVGGVTPTTTYSHILYNPPSIGGNTTGAAATLNTNVFYTGACQVVGTATNTWQFSNAFYSDDTTANTIRWTLTDVVTGTEAYTVDGTNSISDYYPCMKSLFDRMEAKRTTNRGGYDRLKADFELASSNYQMLEAALNSDYSTDVNTYALEIQRLTGCSPTTASTQVFGIGTTSEITRKYVDTITGTTYTPLDANSNAALVGYSTEDIFVFIDSEFSDGAAATTNTLNSSTGVITFGASLISATVTVYINKP